MNYLVNAFLTRNDEKLLPGCIFFEAPRIHKLKYGENFLQGIQRGNQIKRLASQHPAYTASRNRLNLKFYKHSASIIDIFYDHFLATKWNQYSIIPLAEFSENIYRVIENQQEFLPFKSIKLFQLMKQRNWLLSYSSIVGLHLYMKDIIISDSFQQFLEYSLEDLLLHYEEFKEDFECVFEYLQEQYQPEMLQHIHKRISR